MQRNEAFFVRFQKTRNISDQAIDDLMPQWIRTEQGNGKIVWSFGNKQTIKKATQSVSISNSKKEEDDEEDERKGDHDMSSELTIRSLEPITPVLRSLKSDGEINFEGDEYKFGVDMNREVDRNTRKLHISLDLRLYRVYNCIHLCKLSICYLLCIRNKRFSQRFCIRVWRESGMALCTI